MSDGSPIIHFTPEAIREQIEHNSENGITSQFDDFIDNADDNVLRQIAEIAYWDDRMWDVFAKVVNDATAYVFNKYQAPGEGDSCPNCPDALGPGGVCGQCGWTLRSV
jgi:hypothetical protein